MATKMVIEFSVVNIPVRMDLAVESEKKDGPDRHRCCEHADGSLHRTEQWVACLDCANRKTGRGVYASTDERRSLVWGIDGEDGLEAAAEEEEECGKKFNVVKFVDLGTFDPMEYGKPYHLTPDSSAASNADKNCAALVAALDESGLVVEVEYVMRKGGVLHRAVIRPKDGALVVQNLVNLKPAPAVKPVGVDDRLLRQMLVVIESETEAEVADLTARIAEAAKKPRRRTRKTA
jgi:hypothetical protein